MQNPNYLILDMSWIAVCERDHFAFFLKLPLQFIIEKLLHKTACTNINQSLMFRQDEFLEEEIYARFTPDELDAIGSTFISQLFEQVFAKIHLQVCENTLHEDTIDDDYVFHRWLSPYSLMLERIDTRMDDHPRYLPQHPKEHLPHIKLPA